VAAAARGGVARATSHHLPDRAQACAVGGADGSGFAVVLVVQAASAAGEVGLRPDGAARILPVPGALAIGAAAHFVAVGAGGDDRRAPHAVVA